MPIDKWLRDADERRRQLLSGEWKDVPVDKVPIGTSIKEILSAIGYVAGAFFLFAAVHMAFMKTTPLAAKGFFPVIALVVVAIAVSLDRPHVWKRKAGLALLAGVGLGAAFPLIVNLGALSEPRQPAAMTLSRMYGDVAIGGLLAVVLAAVGVVLWRAGRTVG